MKEKSNFLTKISFMSFFYEEYDENKELLNRSIQDNPIVCDCNLVIPRAFYDRRAKCVEPSALKNTFILSLKGKEIQCGEEYIAVLSLRIRYFTRFKKRFFFYKFV